MKLLKETLSSNGVTINHLFFTLCKGCSMYEPEIKHTCGLLYSDVQILEADHAIDVFCRHEKTCNELSERLIGLIRNAKGGE